MNKVTAAFFAITIFSLTSCTLPFSTPPMAKTFYVLQSDNSLDLPLAEHRKNSHLGIAVTSGSRDLNSNRIQFSKSNLERGWYQYAFWQDPPTLSLARILTDILARADAFNYVTTNSEVTPDISLIINILDCYHDTSSKPGNIILTVNAELVKTKQASLLSAKRFSQVTPVNSLDAESAVESFQRAFNQLSAEVATWTIEESPIN